MFECRTFITVKEIGKVLAKFILFDASRIVSHVYELPSAFSRYRYMTNDIKQVKK